MLLYLPADSKFTNPTTGGERKTFVLLKNKIDQDSFLSKAGEHSC